MVAPNSTISHTLDAEAKRVRQRYDTRQQNGRADQYTVAEPHYLYELMKVEFYTVMLASRALGENLPHSTALEIGCGRGEILQCLVRAGIPPESCHGVDLLNRDVEAAKRKLPTAPIIVGDAGRLPYADASFDLVLQSTVFTSILDEDVRHQVAKEMLRVLKPNGHVIWFDFRFNNPSNPDVKSVTPKQRMEYFGNTMNWKWRRKVTVAPPLARAISKLSVSILPLLESLKLFNTHEFCLGQKNIAGE